jgi:hypothetical protein
MWEAAGKNYHPINGDHVGPASQQFVVTLTGTIRIIATGFSAQNCPRLGSTIR